MAPWLECALSLLQNAVENVPVSRQNEADIEKISQNKGKGQGRREQPVRRLHSGETADQ